MINRFSFIFIVKIKKLDRLSDHKRLIVTFQKES